MRDKDLHILQETYKNLNKLRIVKEEAKTSYFAKVPLHITQTGKLRYDLEPTENSTDHDIKVVLRFNIDIDYADFGIEAMFARPVSIDAFELRGVDYTKQEGEEGESVPVKFESIDVREANISYEKNENSSLIQFYPYEIYISVDENFKVIPEKTSITFYT
jgi:hypothetical protein